jgi:putative chitinase
MEFLLTNSITFLSIFNKYAINTPRRIAHFLAQLHEESGGFIKFNESLNYSPQGLMKTFGTNQISVAQANLYGRTAKQKANQQAIANIVYGGNWGKINLGNIQVGDGWRFRGRGLIQLTGRANYQAYKDYSGHDVIANPDWFWSVRFKLNPIADTNNINSITKKINGGLTNLDERVKQLNHYITIDTLGILKKKVKTKLLLNPYYNFWSRFLHLDY